MTKIQVPEGMLEAGFAALQDCEKQGNPPAYFAFLRGALQWLSQHPIVPTDEQAKEIIVDLNDSGYCIADAMGNAQTVTGSNMRDAGRIVAESWGRRMFLAEPEIPEEIKDLLIEADSNGNFYQDTVIEAFRRGRSKG